MKPEIQALMEEVKKLERMVKFFMLKKDEQWTKDGVIPIRIKVHVDEEK